MQQLYYLVFFVLIFMFNAAFYFAGDLGEQKYNPIPAFAVSLLIGLCAVFVMRVKVWSLRRREKYPLWPLQESASAAEQSASADIKKAAIADDRP